MDKLKEYLEDCEQKRRRIRARPSDAVLKELRDLLDAVEEAREDYAALSERSATTPRQPSGTARAQKPDGVGGRPSFSVDGRAQNRSLRDDPAPVTHRE